MAVTLADQVPDGATVLIDTNPIVYLLEGNPLGSLSTLEEGLAYSLGRIRAAALKLEHAPDFVRYDLLERFGKLV
jgi:hypothetical protein